MKSLKEILYPVLIAISIAVTIGVMTWDIKFWPTDAEAYYMPAMEKLSHLQYISQIHDGSDKIRERWLHGKEMVIWAGHAFQKMLHDTTTLRPLLLMFILSTLFSSILAYLIARRYWGVMIGWSCFLIFVTTYWPYLYILFNKHQPLGLFFALLAILFLQVSPPGIKGSLFFLLSGLALGLSLCSSTVSPLYAAFWLAAFARAHFGGHEEHRTFSRTFKNIFSAGFSALAGLFMVACIIYYPDIIGNLKGFWEYVSINKNYNHSYYNQPNLVQWFPHQDLQILRGGWVWVFKYLLNSLPVLFPFYLVCISFLICNLLRADRRSILSDLGMICLSITPLLLAEIFQVGQVGGNYFPSLVGIIMLVGYSLFKLFNCDFFHQKSLSVRKNILLFFQGLLCLHLMVNFYFFACDIYPTRMAVTFLSKKIEALNIDHLYSYPRHRLREYFVDTLGSEVIKKVRFTAITSVMEPSAGYILIPPVTGDSIYLGMTSDYTDYDADVFLNEIIKKGKLSEYAAASFRTLANSRIWMWEEEIHSYRSLMLNHFSKQDPDRGKVWLLDAQKLRKDATQYIPSSDTLELIKARIRNIGTQQKIYMYKGTRKSLTETSSLDTLIEPIYKVGQPRDALIAYIYKVEKELPVWIPVGLSDYASVPVPAAEIPAQLGSQGVAFHFAKPIILPPGTYNIVIYRTGIPDDQNFYRILSGERNEDPYYLSLVAGLSGLKGH